LYTIRSQHTSTHKNRLKNAFLLICELWVNGPSFSREDKRTRLVTKDACHVHAYISTRHQPNTHLSTSQSFSHITDNTVTRRMRSTKRRFTKRLEIRLECGERTIRRAAGVDLGWARESGLLDR
ncbi:unnamed protein product, partial [Ectocarpus sp. 4 AP-2014]